MITPAIETQHRLIKEDLEKSNLTAEDKGRFLTMLESSKACCNGMTQEEKVAGLAENSFSVNCVLARLTMMLKEPRVSTWKDVAIKAMNSWKVVIIIGILAVLLGFHPEIAQVIASYGANP